MDNSICPVSRQDWRNWLEENHQREKSVWLIYYKSGVDKPTVSYNNAVDEALCFGWIDSVRKKLDDERFIQYFSQRKSGSGWSKLNKTKIAQLMKEGRMSPAGLACIDRAKKDGSWTLFDELEELIIPADLKKAFRRHKGSEKYFKALSPSMQKALLKWVVTAKQAATREKRVEEIASGAAKGDLKGLVN